MSLSCAAARDLTDAICASRLLFSCFMAATCKGLEF